MQQVLGHWREIGATAARTSVVPANTGATRLYESLGFRLTGEEESRELVMRLDLDQSGSIPRVAHHSSP